MSRIRVQLLTAAALIAATSLAGGTTAWASAAARPHTQAHATVRPDTVQGYGIGTGATAAAAQKAALDELRGNYRGCGPYTLVYDTGGSGGWMAEVTATCAYYT
ncbi:MAG TPA: hypothetical protein VHY58_02120 [Streptosporangiaceae bacterium]|jgi:hypothetical protein|nr:hypothetical protein [Streptosporangiaceae bacterium]